MPAVAIIGGGISGLTSAFYISKALPGCTVTLFEEENRLGGKIKSEKHHGFLFEHGPNGFMDSRQEMLDLCNELGLNEQMIKSNDASAERLILKEGKLKRLPKKPPQIFTSNFLPSSFESYSAKFLRKPLVKLAGRQLFLLCFDPWETFLDYHSDGPLLR